jgi:GNAT superfamily N-acetyltransferase
MLLTREFDERIRRSELDGIRNGLATIARLFPDTELASVEIAGGVARYSSIEATFSQAFGVGIDVAVSDEDVARLTEFYVSRNATARVVVTPLADPTLAPRLAAAGYAPTEYENVLISDRFEPYAARDERIVAAGDIAGWARASAQAFCGVEDLAPGDDRIAIILAKSADVIALELREGDAIASTAALDVRGDFAALFAGSTSPRFRGRGFHLALIRDRVARARDAGARLMRAHAQPGTTSERNFRRCGFNVLYTRTTWERPTQASP